jgi:peptidyl-prolyl cis-trans isomerase A (cyclophilin A)
MRIVMLTAAFLALMPAAGLVASAQVNKAALKDPAKLKEKAPATFKVKFETTKGDIIVDVTRAWAPNGADRFYNLVKNGFYDGVKFFRVVPNFVVQFGMHGDPEIGKHWQNASIQDEPVKEGNKRGNIVYAMGGPNTRTTQIFINLKDNDFLDSRGFPAFGKVVKGMDVVDKLYSGYGEEAGRAQGEIAAGGNAYLEKTFPKLDAVKKATIVK